MFADTKVVQIYDISKFIFKNFTTCANDRHLPSLTLFRTAALQAVPCAISVLLTYSFSVTYSHASTPCRPPRRQVYIVLNIQKILTFPRIRTSFFQIKVGILLYGYLPPIRIGANYSSAQRYFGNPRSPMSMQCGTEEKFGNPVYFAILSQYNTEVGYRLAALPSK